MKRLPVFFVALLMVALLAALTTPAVAEDKNLDKAQGRVKSITSDKSEFVLNDLKNKNWTFHLDRDGKVFINDKAAKLADLQAGDDVIVSYQKEDNRFVARNVRCTRK